MSAKKFEKMIECIVNDDEAKAKALFHDIIVEKSRQIYESMMAEDQSMGFMDEIESEENGPMMEDDEFETDEEISGDYDVEGDDEEFDMDDEEDMEDDEFEMDAEEDDMGEEDEDGLEDRVVDLEDKLDQLMADFEAQMGDEEFDDEEVEIDSEEDFDDGDEEIDSEEEVMESVELKKVSVTHGDNGVQTKSAVRANSGAQGMASKPVKFSGDTESVPTSASKPSNVYAKGETKMGTGMKNVDGAYKFSEKGEAATKPAKTSPAGTNTRSAVPESKRTTKKRI